MLEMSRHLLMDMIQPSSPKMRSINEILSSFTYQGDLIEDDYYRMSFWLSSMETKIIDPAGPAEAH